MYSYEMKSRSYEDLLAYATGAYVDSKNVPVPLPKSAFDLIWEELKTDALHMYRFKKNVFFAILGTGALFGLLFGKCISTCMGGASKVKAE